jgi:hypothetical protein
VSGLETEVDGGIWLVSVMDYDLGYIDLEEKTLQPLNNPLGPKVLPMSPGRTREELALDQKRGQTLDPKMVKHSWENTF